MCNDKIYSSFDKQVNPISNKDRRLSRSLFNKLTFLLKNHSVTSKQNRREVTKLSIYEYNKELHEKSYEQMLREKDLS